MLYRGSAIRRFLIDRLAMGIPMDTIRDEFQATQGVSVTESDIDSIVGGAEDEIKAREAELLEELSSSNFISSLYTIKDELNEARQLAKDDGDLKSYAQLTNTLLKSVDSLIQFSNNMRNKKVVEKKTLVQNNLLVINVLEKEGILKIIDKPKLETLIGTAHKEEESAGSGS